MDGKKLQLLGIILYGILAVISTCCILISMLNYSASSAYGLFAFLGILLLNSDILILRSNYLKTSIGHLVYMIFTTFIRIAIGVFISKLLTGLIGMDMPSDKTYKDVLIQMFNNPILCMEIFAKSILGIYNIGIAVYVLSKNNFFYKLLSKIKSNENVTIVARYDKVVSNDTITLVYKTIDGMSIENVEQITQNIDSSYKVNLINLNDIKDKEKYDDIISNGIELYNDGRVENLDY